MSQQGDGDALQDLLADLSEEVDFDEEPVPDGEFMSASHAEEGDAPGASASAAAAHVQRSPAADIAWSDANASASSQPPDARWAGHRDLQRRIVPDSSRLSTHESAAQRANRRPMRHCPRALPRPAMTCGSHWVRLLMEQLWPEGAAVLLVSDLRHKAQQAAWAAEPSLPRGAPSPAGPMPPDMHVAVTPNLHCSAHSSGISVIRPQRLRGSATKEWPRAPPTVVAPAAAAAVRPSRLILRAPRRFG